VGFPLNHRAERTAASAPPPSRSLSEPATGTDWMRAVLVASIAVALIAAVYAIAFPNLWYGEHDVSDVVIYQGYAQSMAAGQQPYRDFAFEYPPLAAWLLALPGHAASYDAYTLWFSFWMFVITAATAVVVSLAAVRLWPSGAKPYAAAFLFAAAVAAVGAIVENRFDIAVALVMAIALVLLARRRLLWAAGVIGIGFALKLTPVVLLPLVLLLAPTLRRAAAAVGVFAASALAPFLPYLAMAPGGVWHIFAYFLQRPLQIESTISTPFLLGKVLGKTWVDVTTTYGSQAIVATGVHTAETISTVLTLAAMLAVYGLLLRRRRLFLESPRALPLAALASVLATMVFAKVLSPQYFIWLLPMVALVALEEPLVGGLSFAVLLLTQINFPAKYWGLVYLEPSSIEWLAARNLVLVIAFAATLWRLARLPASLSANAQPTPDPPATLLNTLAQ
jgi:hypothetical protein